MADNDAGGSGVADVIAEVDYAVEDPGAVDEAIVPDLAVVDAAEPVVPRDIRAEAASPEHLKTHKPKSKG